MKKKICLTVAFYFAAAVYTKTLHAQSWQVVKGIPSKGNIDFVVVHPDHSDFLFVGADGGLYASFDGGKGWKRLIGLGRTAETHELWIGNGRMFLASSVGLFEADNLGGKWKRVFSGVKNEEGNVQTIAEDPLVKNRFYMGTAGGLFESSDNGRMWRKVSNELGRQSIQKIETDRELGEIFVAADKGLYRLRSEGANVDRVYVTSVSERPEDFETETTEDTDEEKPAASSRIHIVKITESPVPAVAIGTRDGVFVSEDEGNFWLRLSTSGLKNPDVLDLLHLPNERWLAATAKGVFLYDFESRSWRELYGGFPAARVNRLAVSAREPERVYAATEDGVYQIKIEIGVPSPEAALALPSAKWKLLNELISLEPPIRNVQQKAIRYANVSHWKTKRWQWASRLKALVPSISVGKSFSVSDNVDIDRGSTNDRDTFIIGPREKDRRFDVDLKWDVSELIWNSAQTSIDSREKLTVELRDDILAEVTRVYFERRRTQVEFVLNPPPDMLNRMTTLLRIDELTANLDALTNGFMSRELSDIYEQNPKFYELWQGAEAPLAS